MRTKGFHRFSILLFPFLLLGGCGPSQEEFDELKSEQERLKKEIRKLKTKEEKKDTSEGEQNTEELLEELQRESDSPKESKGVGYIDPSDRFLSSTVWVSGPGISNVPFGHFSVKEMVKRLSEEQLGNGEYPDIKGWTKEDNEYTLHFEMQGEKCRFSFRHLLNREGKFSFFTEGHFGKDRLSGYQILGNMRFLTKDG